MGSNYPICILTSFEYWAVALVQLLVLKIFPANLNKHLSFGLRSLLQRYHDW